MEAIGLAPLLFSLEQAPILSKLIVMKYVAGFGLNFNKFVDLSFTELIFPIYFKILGPEVISGFLGVKKTGLLK